MISTFSARFSGFNRDLSTHSFEFRRFSWERFGPFRTCQNFPEFTISTGNKTETFSQVVRGDHGRPPTAKQSLRTSQGFEALEAAETGWN